MLDPRRKAKWGSPYLALPLAVGLFWLQMQAPLPEAGHRIEEMGIVLLIYGLAALWLRANQQAIMNEDYAAQQACSYQDRPGFILGEETSGGSEFHNSLLEPTLPPIMKVAANGQGRMPRSLVTSWSDADSGPLPIQHSQFDAWMVGWADGTDE